ncbi:two-component system, OmpR family, sensor histidine kinase KdpD [Paenibacillus sp. UNCCL117]|uniref:universal stress protein n=1 Tax=unclassified Paenibacillus TaxID=185978 RepID=UPI00087F8423|nr:MULTISPECIES: universal stress protein [unclassified Paenibacillus]SDE33217.1 two-component system, OmpR family, sensor histidine kinase KdpD [Paenibacillus sp. cl123]SFW63972.1 two-component system, OmpR family, sensor histidine kinase KdpD [Paenibacillus sp. UNCCL117]
MKDFGRKTPEEILDSISRLRRGRLTILIGAVSGSGKTYHMLREGHALKKQGIDVVICAVSTRQRPETVEQLGDLERVPSIHWQEQGEEKKDLNLDALIERNPEVMLVDGLAHRNREGARFGTRWDDIRYLLDCGISVITTVNVYELEGVMALAKTYAGVKAEATVPANVLEQADEVRLIDVTPETVLQRYAEGHVRGNPNPAVFERGNLAVLRELALRVVAEGVNASLDKHREAAGLVGPSGATERILVSVQYHWNGSIYIRRGQQIAKRLGGDMLAVAFVNRKKPLNREAETFKRSIIKLVNKVGGEFAELPFNSRHALPAKLVRYALEHNVTRIVMGHSKQSRWQELWQGSIVNDMLRKTKNIDIFLVADRAEHEGERIMPAKIAAPAPGELYRRLSTPEMEQKIGQIRRGKFKVYIGAAPGVGKTYTMLREGNHLLKKGIDVVVGLLETHGRQETADQREQLPTIERRTESYRGTELKEMDTEAIIRRNPEVALIDELAHTNVPGSKYKKRYEDVLEILAAGISVISTVNVQHLESLNDAVEQITGVRVRETVPDAILRLADEVELIDVAPQALQQRMREGKIYAMEKVDQALGHFFKTGNLIALRELALREIADDVDERLEAWERRSSLRGPWRRQEMIFVCVNTDSNAERLIRRGFRIAYRLKAPWVAVYVRTEGQSGQDEEGSKKVRTLETLARRLGGEFEIVLGSKPNEVAGALLSKAREYRASQLIIGQSKRSLSKRLLQGSVVSKLLRLARDMDVLVVARYDPHVRMDEE